MTNQELERRLNRALSHATPDDLEGVLSRCETRKGTVIPMTNNKIEQPRSKKTWLSLAAAACLALVVAGGGFGYYRANHTVASIVSLDVNPCVELTVNGKEKVLSAAPKNADGAVILENLDLKDTKVDVAFHAVIGSLLQHGFIDELANSILITVEDNDTLRGEKLQQELAVQAEAVLNSAQVNGAILSQTLQHSDDLSRRAEEYGISAGKASLIQTIVEASNNTKTFESLVGLSINELNLLYSSESPALSTAAQGEAVIGGADAPTSIFVASPIQTSGTASQTAYIGLDAAKAAALSHAGVTASQAAFLEAEYDYDDGRMLYEVEFRVNGTKYEYEIDALTGEVIKHETELSGSSQNAAASGGSLIGEAAAKAAALSDAGIKESETTYCNVWLSYDDGRPEYYEVEFLSGSTRYEYEIALTSATVLKQETKNLSASQAAAASSAASAGDIGEAAAKSAAYKHAGVTASQVSRVTAKRDYDDGRIEYEIEFWAGSTEYDYTINGADGSILDYDVERHDGSGYGSNADIGEAAA